jgi:hypothetical protein
MDDVKPDCRRVALTGEEEGVVDKPLRVEEAELRWFVRCR